MTDGVDLFSGARGWEARAHASLGVDLLGVEHWQPACDTSAAAGLRTLQADVAALDPREVLDGPCDILIGSPPCQSRSNAGKRLGAMHDVGIVTDCMADLARGIDSRIDARKACADERSILTVEPLRWALALRPRVVLLEQVPSVLPDWRLVGSLLAAVGYSWWAGVLEAERYGVPQTRERAVLIARRDTAAVPPQPTHHRYVKGSENDPHPSLFDGLLPWVSMQAALGWGPGAVVNTRGARRTSGGNDFPASRPSWALTEKARSWRYRAGAMANQAVRALEEPAPTIGAFGHDVARAGWVNGEEFERLALADALTLQSFPPDWPLQGSNTARFLQVGNAVPPLLAEAILRTVVV